MFSAAARIDWLRLEFLRAFVTELSFDQFREGDVGQSHAGLAENHWTVAIDQLAHSAGDDVYEVAVVWKNDKRLVEEMRLHAYFVLPTQEADRADS
jgi:hypothetical protein